MTRPLAVYIHWPFCSRKCPYCDYNSHVREKITPDDWQTAFGTAIDTLSQQYPGRHIETVFFGGGTPSLMPPGIAGFILDKLARTFSISANPEITLEANPARSSASLFQDFRNAGINRLSIGVQALDDNALQFLGREHSRAQALETIESAARIMPRWSADMMYGRPAQTLEGWQQELDMLFQYQPKHVSLYQLTVEPDTRFWQLQQQGLLELPDEESQLAFYETTLTTCEQHGLQPYEISSAATAGEECRHNLAYWNYQEYLGIGPGAHGRVVQEDGYRYALEDIRSPEKWLETVGGQGHGLKQQQKLDARAELEERLLLGLRTIQGVTLKNPERFFPKPLLQHLQQENLLHLTPNSLCATRKGWQILNWLEQELSGSLLLPAD